jgi:hypothetical protein
VQAEDPDSITQTGENSALPAIGELRLIALEAPSTPQRRFGPRRRIVAAIMLERRRADRRREKPGIDGLLRMVLADTWQHNPNAMRLRLIQ